ncbi:nineteen complex-related protein 2-domain-containing protein [Terfezia claveryi]|nr:nineteen complex-related protein 2-domain-containing protein [Terfezia claveryi]
MRSARRFNKPRKVGADSEDEESTAPAAVVKKKINKKPTSSTAAAKPSTNLSFTDPPDATDKPFAVKKSALSRKSLERAAAARSLLQDNGGVDTQEEKVTLYSKEYLEELRSETPSTSTPFQAGDGDVAMCEAGAGDPLDTFSKFGTTATAAAAKLPTDLGGMAIPDPALVKVLKARRAAEATKSTSTEYISLSPTHSSASEDDNGRVRRKKPSRLVRTEILDEDDEQLATFIHDPSTSTSTAHPSRLILTSALSSRAGALQEEKYLRRGQIQEALLGISSSESSSDDSSHADDDDDGNNNAPDWHRRQLRIATGLSSLDVKDDPTSSLDARLRYQPPAIPPVPELDGKLKWLQEVLAEMVRARDGLAWRVEEVRREKEEIRRRETEVQESLGRLSEQYSRLGIAEPEEKTPGGEGVEGMGRGLESLGVR